MKRHFSELRLSEFNEVKFDAAVAWLRRTRIGVIFLNIVSLEVLAVVSLLKKIKSRVKGQSHLKATMTEQEELTLLPQTQEKPRVLMIVEASIPQCLHYRVKQKVEQFDAIGFYAEWYDWSDISMLQQAMYRFDAIIFYRVPGYPAILDLMQHAKALRKLVLYDIDDLIFDRGQLQNTFQQTTEQLNDKDLQGILTGADLYKSAIEAAHYGIASTPSLQAELAKLVEFKHCFVLPNGLDARIESLAENEKMLANDNVVRIFYGSGTKTHDEDFAIVAKPLAQLLEENSQVQLVLAGQLSVPTVLQKYNDRIQRLPSMDFESYLSCLKYSDIAIAPLKPGIFADCKSEIKWLEAACFQVPSVVSSNDCYVNVIEHEKTGFLAETTEQWFAAMSTLVKDVPYRKKVGVSAQEYALKHYSSKAMAQQMQSLFDEVQTQAVADHLMQSRVISTQGKANKKRILIVNVLFPPNAIGGATTIAVKSVDGLLKTYSDDIELEVLTSEVNDKSPYTLREYEYLGVKVTAIQVPSHHQLESREFDKNVFELCQQWLPQNRPDLIHFHSMQRLTASPLQAAQALNIPYYVTVHDAWWISEHQFLLDEKDELVDLRQSNPMVAAKTTLALGTALQRTRYLAQQLRGAKRIFAVSDFQAGLYNDNGFDQVDVLKNGVSSSSTGPFTSLESAAPASRKPNNAKSDMQEALVIGYLGGISAHKGHHFLYDIVNAENFDRLCFKVVDLFKPADYEERSQWGDSTVIRLGKQVGMALDDFYQNIDVLIAPSIWPESFGLVTREAALRGVWVVAADAGGMAEDVVEQETGFVFPMNDANSCADILSKLNQGWQEYKNSKPNLALSQERIFSQQQHIELLAKHYLN